MSRKIDTSDLSALSVEDLTYLRDRGKITDAEYEEHVEEDEGYGNLTKKQLVAELESRDLDTDGTKAELIARLEEDDDGD